MARKIQKKTHLQILHSKPTVAQVKKFKRLPVVIVLDNLRSLYNVGSIFRTADALLIEKIYLCGITGSPPNKQIEKVALGAVETVPFECFEKVDEVIKMLKKEGRQIVTVELTDQSKNYREAEYQFPLALVLGNEIDGVQEEVVENADLAVDIPMKGRANSLNVATAMAVVAYEIAAKYGNS
ncbi:RNA methyltransferase [Candidatus Peregrinibacteria bacterium]|nr:RNA methyltransferase [Candidatus Peregrinibacteria bacterium]